MFVFNEVTLNNASITYLHFRVKIHTFNFHFKSNITLNIEKKIESSWNDYRRLTWCVLNFFPIHLKDYIDFRYYTMNFQWLKTSYIKRQRKTNSVKKNYTYNRYWITKSKIQKFIKQKLFKTSLLPKVHSQLLLTAQFWCQKIVWFLI